jgi:tetratricopeptide (TPR) repeat protein
MFHFELIYRRSIIIKGTSWVFPKRVGTSKSPEVRQRGEALTNCFPACSTLTQNSTINIVIGAKEFVLSLFGGNGKFNTHIGTADGCDANGIPNAHHTWIGYLGEKNFEQALEWNTKAYEFYVERNGPRHSDTIAEKRNRALILAYWGKVEEAICDIDKTVDECREAFPPGDPGDEITLVTMDKASLVYQIGKKYYVAEALSKETCTMYEEHKKFGRTHPSTLSAMLRRAMLLEYGKKYEDAKDLYEKAYANVCQDAARPPDLYSILIMYHRACLFDNLQDDKPKARGAYKDARDACRKFLEKDPGNENVCAIRDRIPP